MFRPTEQSYLGHPRCKVSRSGKRKSNKSKNESLAWHQAHLFSLQFPSSKPNSDVGICWASAPKTEVELSLFFCSTAGTNDSTTLIQASSSNPDDSAPRAFKSIASIHRCILWCLSSWNPWTSATYEQAISEAPPKKKVWVLQYSPFSSMQVCHTQTTWNNMKQLL